MRVLITQSMLFPWIGMLESIKLADVIVHYDDVQFSKGSFTNRVQVKTAQGCRWLTVPLSGLHIGQRICDVSVVDEAAWRSRHMAILEESFRGAPYASEALEIAENVYSRRYSDIGSLARASMLSLAQYFGLVEGKTVLDVRTLGVAGYGSQRVLDVVIAVGGKTYITGHGARNYLDHEAFEASGVAVEYMSYSKLAYPQAFGDFNPYVTALDLVAQCGRNGLLYIRPNCVAWRQFLN